MLTKFYNFDQISQFRFKEVLVKKQTVKKHYLNGGEENFPQFIHMTVLTYKVREEIWDYLGIFHKHRTPPPPPPFWEPLVKKTLPEAHRTQGIESIF